MKGTLYLHKLYAFLTDIDTDMHMVMTEWDFQYMGWNGFYSPGAPIYSTNLSDGTLNVYEASIPVARFSDLSIYAPGIK